MVLLQMNNISYRVIIMMKYELTLLQLQSDQYSTITASGTMRLTQSWNAATEVWVCRT